MKEEGVSFDDKEFIARVVGDEIDGAGSQVGVPM